MKTTIGMDYSRPAELVTSGDEAMLKVDVHTLEVTLHPDLVAYGTGDVGLLAIQDWQGALGYRRGYGTCSNEQGRVCIGDAVCEAIDRGQIPLRPRDELPQHLRPGWSRGV